MDFRGLSAHFRGAHPKENWKKIKAEYFGKPSKKQSKQAASALPSGAIPISIPVQVADHRFSLQLEINITPGRLIAQ